jgi:PhnB protein
MTVVTTLNFAGRTEEAVDFYRDAVGAQTLFLMRVGDGPEPWRSQPALADKIFHATFRIGETTFMASDVSDAPPAFAGFSLAIKADSADHASTMFAALSVGGTVRVPLAPAAFTSQYGIVIDRFGVSWKITVE